MPGHPPPGPLHPVGYLYRDGDVGRSGAVHSQSLFGSAPRNRSPHETPCSRRAHDVELGFHLCYGDWEAKHFIEPADAGKLAEFANLLADSISRPITYVHMPVPIDRSDDAYFEPLRKLKLAPDTDLFLGLVHGDGVEATRKRIETAAKYVADFGIATECGMARCRTPEIVRDLLAIHAAASAEPQALAHSVPSKA